MVVDSSVILAIVFREPGSEFLARKVAEREGSRMSAASKVETASVVYRRTGHQGLIDVEEAYRTLGIEFVPFDTIQADLAIVALQRYGKGTHPAKLNFGDCLVYALAKSLNEPLLFIGNDFSQTDITPAWR